MKERMAATHLSLASVQTSKILAGNDSTKNTEPTFEGNIESFQAPNVRNSLEYDKQRHQNWSKMTE